MNDEASSLVLELDAPLRYIHLSELPPESQRLASSQQNERILKALWFFNEDASRDLKDEHEGLAKELTRLETKVDMLLSVLGSWVAQHSELPATTRVRLGNRQLQWPGSATLQLGQILQVEVFLLPGLLAPLLLTGTLVQGEPKGGDTWWTLEFQGLSPQADEYLHKIIFREHRRQIARQRLHPNAH